MVDTMLGAPRDQHRAQQAQGPDVRGHQGGRADELQTGRGALGKLIAARVGVRLTSLILRPWKSP